MAGLGPENVPGSPKLGVWVLAGHDAPLDSMEAMFDPDFLEIMGQEGITHE